MKRCPRCNYPGKDPGRQAGGRHRNPNKGFGTLAVRLKALETRRKNREALEGKQS
jgi:hypothetical protein